MSRGNPRRQGGMSLLEVLVAFVIMSMALGMIYTAAGSSVRDLGEVEMQQQASELGESILASKDGIEEEGWQANGRVGAFDWSARTVPFPTEFNGNPKAAKLHELAVTIAWQDRKGPRQLTLNTLRPQLAPPTRVN